MALSQNAARALEQVKMGLFMLYGADYFTPDEFVKIDYLINKGRYIFTNGPPNHMHDEELISFVESKDEMKPINVQTNSIQSSESSKKDTIVIMEEQIPSPSSSEGASEGAESHFQPDETPNATSAETSSNEETAPPTSATAEAAPTFDFSEPTASKSSDAKPHPQPQTSNGLPPGITQQQLDEARMMQAAMTKAGKKPRPKYERHEEQTPEPVWADDLPVEPTMAEETFSSPARSERDTRISSWASEVDAQQTPSLQPLCPAPNKTAVDLKTLAEEEFIKAHGRKPKSVNDFYQPNNPAHFSNRPVSRASNATTKTAKTTKTSKAAPKISLKINPGSTYIAQNAQVKTSHIVLDVRAGDHIRTFKYVSGIMWVGTNLRTNANGQFSEDIFKKTVTTPKPNPKKPSVETPSVAPSVTSSAIRNGLENVEGVNATEWDELPVTPRPKPVAPTPIRPALGSGLASSRFSVLTNKAEPKLQVASEKEITPAMLKEFGKVVDKKVDEILKARGMAPTPAPAPPTAPSRSRTLNEPLKPVSPKVNTCWFWATNKGCRFTAEECRDLHGYLPTASSEPTNLHMGKPTWGALADSSPIVGHANPDSFSVPQVTSHNDERTRTLTCWYWAKDGKCNYTQDTCKYLHEHTPKGIASRPWQKFPSWGAHTWKRGEDGETVDGTVAAESEAGGESGREGELVLQEVNAEDCMSIAGWGVIGDGGAGGWGRETPVLDTASAWGGADDKYKPPHIKALEEKAKIEAVGW